MQVLDAQMQLRTCRHPAWPIATLGNCHCNNRVYSIQAGRWTTPDPVATPWWNMTSYVCCFLQLSDPTGLADSGLPPDPGHNSRNHLKDLEEAAAKQGKCLYVSTLRDDTKTIEYRIDDCPPDHRGKRVYWGSKWVSMWDDGIGDCVKKTYKFRKMPTNADLDDYSKKLKAWEQEMKVWVGGRKTAEDIIEEGRQRATRQAGEKYKKCQLNCLLLFTLCVGGSGVGGPKGVAAGLVLCTIALQACELSCRDNYKTDRDHADENAEAEKRNWPRQNPQPPVPPLPANPEYEYP